MKQGALNTLGVNTKKKGWLLFLFTLIITLSLFSYSPKDNCLNVVSNIKTHNFLGSFGAIISDLLYQYFGFSILIIIPFLFYISVNFILKKQKRFIKFKLFYAFISTICLSFLLSSITILITKYQYIFTIPIGGKIGYLLSRIDILITIKIFSILFSILILSFFPYICFIFGSKTKRQIIKERKNNSIALFFYNLIKYSSLLFKFLYFILSYPFVFLKYTYFLIFKRENFKIKKFNFKKNKQQLKEDIKNDNNEIKYLEQKTYDKPLSSLLKIISKENTQQSQIICKENMQKLSTILSEFGVRGDMIGYKSGPIVTLYEFKPQAGVKASRIIGLSDDIARTMMVGSVRIATILGRDTLGIEIPNQSRETVCFRKLIESQEYTESKAKIPMILGCNIFGKPIVADLTEMPHLLIAGTTGSGKSVGINAMILSILYKLSPEECKLIMIDPKMLEFSAYDGIPHLMLPVVTDPKNAVLSLKWVVREMENRYKIMSEAGVRNITGYNEKARIMKEKAIEDGTIDKLNIEPMHYIVVIIDEMADLMVVAGKEIEVLVQRLSQMARAAGIHLIMATQRPSVDVITGVIKSNFPTRISYHVTSKIDSRTILGEQGAEQLLGKGDLLFMFSGTKILRVHGPFISDIEIENVVNYLKKYNDAPKFIQITTNENDDFIGENSFDNDNDNSLYRNAIKIVLNDQKTSISYLQRKLRIGYNKAANFIEKMEEEGILSTPDNTGKRIILKNNKNYE